MTLRLLLAAALTLAALPAAAQTTNPQGTDDWRKVATPQAARSLADLPRRWDAALASAERAEPGAVGALAGVLQPDAVKRPRPLAPGSYRCRSLQIDAPAGRFGLAFVPYGWFKCRVSLSPGGDLRLVKTTGSQRPDGLVFPDARLGFVFVGGLALGTDAAAPPHGASPRTDVIGVVQSIGPNHWRMAAPRPASDTGVDVLELKR